MSEHGLLGSGATRTTDHDSPWKIALEGYFQEFLALLFPVVHAGVNWRRGYNFLDKELQQITADANSGRRYADKLIQVYAEDGSETWVLIHVEVQGEPEAAFAERMYTYQYRLRDRYGVDVVSLAAKLIDWEARWTELRGSANVFALVVMAQIKAKRVKDGASRRKNRCLTSTRLNAWGWNKGDRKG